MTASMMVAIEKTIVIAIGRTIDTTQALRIAATEIVIEIEIETGTEIATGAIEIEDD